MRHTLFLYISNYIQGCVDSGLEQILLYNLILSHKTIKVTDNRHRWTLFICQCVFKKSCKEKSYFKSSKRDWRGCHLINTHKKSSTINLFTVLSHPLVYVLEVCVILNRVFLSEQVHCTASWMNLERENLQHFFTRRKYKQS